MKFKYRKISKIGPQNISTISKSVPKELYIIGK